jgi:hypothetical protein
MTSLLDIHRNERGDYYALMTVCSADISVQLREPLNRASSHNITLIFSTPTIPSWEHAGLVPFQFSYQI